MNASTIKYEAARLKARYQTDNLYEICRQRKIDLLYAPMGKNPGSCKGFYLLNCQCKVIVLNSDLPKRIQEIILAHELGHDVLHSGRAGARFHEFTLLDDSNSLEYEANLFASEFLISDDKVLGAIESYEGDFFHIASELEIPPELLDFKLRMMRHDGYEFDSPLAAAGAFLRRDITKGLV